MAPEQFAIGIDVGGTNMRAARISPSGEILQKRSIAGSRDPAVALGLIKGLAEDMNAAGACAIGIGVPGRVNGWTGDIISGGFLDLSGIDLKQEMAAAFGLPTLVANDCSMALIGEYRRGAAKGLRNAVMMTIGTGIGGAVMECGQIVNGRRSAGQLGHLVVNLGGHPCPCGQRGCVETESSGTSLKRHILEAGYGPDMRFEPLLQQAEAGDTTAIGVLHAWAGPLRAAINTLCAAFDPEVVVLGGGMGLAATRALDFLPELETWYRAEVRHAELGDDAGVIGAGLAALDLQHRPENRNRFSVSLMRRLKKLERPLRVLMNARRSKPKPAPDGGRRLVMINGVPASGKSGLSHALSEKTGWPVLALDTIKNPFLELIETVDRPFNRILGRASYKSIFSIIGESAPGSTFIVDAWFGFQPLEVLREHIARAGVTGVVEVWCHAPPDVIGHRYLTRSSQRLAGHPGAAYVPELMELAHRAEPCRLGPVLPVDTTTPLRVDMILDWVKDHLAPSDSQSIF